MPESEGRRHAAEVKVRDFVCATLLLASLVFAQEPGSAEGPAESSEFKVALVDLQSLCGSYRKTVNTQREIDLVRAEIQKQSQLFSNEIQRRRDSLDERVLEMRKGNASQEEIDQLRREFPVLVRELQIAHKQKQKKRTEANQALNKQMVRRMSGIMEEIVSLIAQKAENEGYDLVIDSSGKSVNQVAPILFIKGAVDLTEEIRRELSE